MEENNGKGAIFLSGIEAARDMETLKEKNIKAVLTVAADCNLDYSKSDVKLHLVINCYDIPD